VSCGAPATFDGACGLTIRRPDALPNDECIELNTVQASHDCPVNFGFPLSVSFQVTASAGNKNFTWRQVSKGTDILTPASGAISSNGVTNVTLSDLVLDDDLGIEIVGQGRTYLVFILKH
jgi:hypothetical protein